MVCHHGAGYSALGFACLAKEVTETTKSECGILAFDARAHGKPAAASVYATANLFSLGRTTSLSSPGQDPATLDLSLSTLASDLLNLIQTMYPDPKVAPSFVVGMHLLRRVSLAL